MPQNDNISFQSSGGCSTDNNAMTIPINGYLAVYISNASVQLDEGNSDVWFDHISIKISKGHLREEKHYYPYGLPMSGIGASDLRQNPNRRRYQSNEYIKAMGLNWMSFGARQYDPQLGRFMSVDPLAAAGGQEMMSPYAAMGDEPVITTDADGKMPFGNLAIKPSVPQISPFSHGIVSIANPTFGGYTQEALKAMTPGFTPNPDPMGIGEWMDEVAVAAKIEEIFNESVGNALTVSGDAAQALFSLLQESSSFQITEKGLAMSFENGDAATFGFNGMMSHSFGVKYAYACNDCKDEKADGTAGDIMSTGAKLAGAAIVAGLGPEDPVADGVAGTILVGFAATAGIVYVWSHPKYISITNFGISLFSAEHTKNARKSTKGKHEKANARRMKARNGYKGTKNPPRKRPNGWKGKWPPK